MSQTKKQGPHVYGDVWKKSEHLGANPAAGWRPAAGWHTPWKAAGHHSYVISHLVHPSPHSAETDRLYCESKSWGWPLQNSNRLLLWGWEYKQALQAAWPQPQLRRNHYKPQKHTTDSRGHCETESSPQAGWENGLLSRASLTPTPRTSLGKKKTTFFFFSFTMTSDLFLGTPTS